MSTSTTSSVVSAANSMPSFDQDDDDDSLVGFTDLETSMSQQFESSISVQSIDNTSDVDFEEIIPSEATSTESVAKPSTCIDELVPLTGCEALPNDANLKPEQVLSNNLGDELIKALEQIAITEGEQRDKDGDNEQEKDGLSGGEERSCEFVHQQVDNDHLEQKQMQTGDENGSSSSTETFSKEFRASVKQNGK